MPKESIDMVIGYTAGVFDLFHYGHVRLLENARALCDKLIVGVTVDELVSYKNKQAFIPFDHRIEVVSACRHVDIAIPQNNMDKVEAMKKLNATVLFVGDDWFGDEKWIEIERALNEIEARVIYFPYTESISSTKINNALRELRS
ncbi:MAG: adenylyltransferase/cytidyltransferase family protein [Rhodobacteraceae bacterium]|nr:adenylyltransferase/cytidyltransferase family protein [Paracoccaceae bacterium]